MWCIAPFTLTSTNVAISNGDSRNVGSGCGYHHRHHRTQSRAVLGWQRSSQRPDCFEKVLTAVQQVREEDRMALATIELAILLALACRTAALDPARLPVGTGAERHVMAQLHGPLPLELEPA